MRKAKRLGSGIRGEFGAAAGGRANRKRHVDHLTRNPYSPDMFKRFADHILSQMGSGNPTEESVLGLGFF